MSLEIKSKKESSSLEIVASCAKVKSSVRKINMVADTIRLKKIDDAVLALVFSKKKVSLFLHKLLMSAVANAQHNYGISIDDLYIDHIYVGQASFLKRFSPRAKGRVNKIVKYYSNIKLILKVVT
ncbi:50S ribosomal protein L22 [Anaplasmataceae bacterium AB001_6]|nr:50S ribosomal protein L22 [Anaplasmataceae bacterium AB001_6]